MNMIARTSDSERYARCVQTSKRVRWDIEEDVIRGRRFDTTHKFLPDGLSLVAEFTTLSADEKRFVSQVQGRTYANIFGLVERFINAKVLELSRDQALGDQVAVARAVLGKSAWAVLALTLDTELFTQAHYRQSIDTDTELSELFTDVFLYHWKEERQH